MTPAVVATARADRGPTVANALRAAGDRLAAAGLATARQDAEALLAPGARDDAARPVHERPGAGDRPRRRAAFETLVARRARHEPLQYLLGEAEFCGLLLALGPGVFIPRPETEGLVDRALALGPPGTASVLDLCTGSGAVACALAARRPGWTVWAVERARPAAECARANVRRLGLEGRVRVREGDLFGPLGGRGRGRGRPRRGQPALSRDAAAADLARRGPRLGAATPRSTAAPTAST